MRFSLTILSDHSATTCRQAVWDSIAGKVCIPAGNNRLERVIVRVDAPLRVSSGQPEGLRLVPGWDGTYGYACYALELPAGCVAAALEIANPTRDPAWVDDLTQRHDPVPSGVLALRAWQVRRRRELATRLMSDLPLALSGTDARREYQKPFEGYTLESWRCTTRPGREIPFLLARPISSPRGLVVALHGHEGTWGDVDPGAFAPGHPDSFCHDMARAGWAVLQPATMDHHRESPERTLLGSWCWDASACLGIVLELLGPVPVTAVCGLSAGGQIAMAMLALDRRLDAGIVAGAFSTWNHYRSRMVIPPHCDCGTTDLFGDWLEHADWLALAAPTPVQIQHGQRDHGFAPDADPTPMEPAWNRAVMPGAEFTAAIAATQQAWHTLGSPENCRFHLHPGGHAVDADAAMHFISGSSTGNERR